MLCIASRRQPSGEGFPCKYGSHAAAQVRQRLGSHATREASRTLTCAYHMRRTSMSEPVHCREHLRARDMPCHTTSSPLESGWRHRSPITSTAMTTKWPRIEPRDMHACTSRPAPAARAPAPRTSACMAPYYPRDSCRLRLAAKTGSTRCAARRPVGGCSHASSAHKIDERLLDREAQPNTEPGERCLGVQRRAWTRSTAERGCMRGLVAERFKIVCAADYKGGAEPFTTQQLKSSSLET